MRALLYTVKFAGIPRVVSLLQTQAVPHQYFCTRAGHSSVRYGDTIFAFGGIRNASMLNGTFPFDQYVVGLNMSDDWTLVNNQNPTFVVSTSNTTNAPPAGLVDGAIFFDSNGDCHVYGGGIGRGNVSYQDSPPTSSPAQNKLWTLRHSTNSWISTAVDIIPSQNSPRELLYAAAPEHNLVFFLNGITNNGSTELANPRMTIYNTISKKSRIVSTSVISPNTRVGAILQYLPLLGRKGGLVLFGGANKGPSNLNTTRWGTLLPLDSIHIFDIASLNETSDGIWYSQYTNGRTPPSRYVTCAVPVTSSDNSNYYIYMFSGRSNTSVYDDIWVLSLPQFRWTQVFQGNRTNYGATCHLVGKKQMLALGGVVAQPYRCWDGPEMALFDMTNLKWYSSYIAEDTEYRVPKAVYEWINGTSMGESKMRTPVGGFSEPGLERLFEHMYNAKASDGSNLIVPTLLHFATVAWVLFLWG